MSELIEAKDRTVRGWLSQFEQGSLTYDDFHQHWQNWIFKAVLPPLDKQHPEPIIKEDILNTLLFESLEDFIFFKNESMLNYSKALPICGKVFENGDFLFRCLDCALDPSCTLCVSCFRNSIHKSHNFKIERSVNYGCCDCGDSRCWKSGSHCEEHLKGLQDKPSNLNSPQELLSKASIVIYAIFRFLKTLVDNLKENKMHDNHYCTLLYDHALLQPEGTKNLHMDLESLEDEDFLRICRHLFEDGWVMLLYSSYEECNKMNIKVDKRKRDLLRLKICPWSFVVNQIFAMKLVSWLGKISKHSENLLDLVTVIGLNLKTHPRVNCSVQEIEGSYVEDIFFCSAQLCKSIQLELYRLFIFAMQVDFENKKAFATAFCRSYEKLMTYLIPEFKPFSIKTLSTQLFKDLQLANFLILHEDIISILLNAFYSVCLGKMNFKVLYQRVELRFNKNGPLYILDNLNHILKSFPQKWNPDLRKNFLNGISIFLKILASEQIEFSKEEFTELRHLFKEKPITFDGKQFKSIKMKILVYCSTDMEVCLNAFRLTLERLYESCGIMKAGIRSNIELEGYSSTYQNSDLLSSSALCHVRLSRFLADLYLIMLKMGYHSNPSEIITTDILTPQLILDPRLSLELLEGISGVLYQNHSLALLTGSNLLENGFRDPKIFRRIKLHNIDLVLYQISASLMEHNEFLLHILHKFNLINWIHNDFEGEDTNVVARAVQCLRLIMTVIKERWNPGIGDLTTDECLKYEISAIVLHETITLSDLTKILAVRGFDKDKIRDACDRFVTIKDTKQLQYGVGKKEVCLLKEKSFDFEYDNKIFTPKNKDLEQTKSWCSSVDKWFPKELLKFIGPFQSIPKILHCDIMLWLMNRILKRSQFPMTNNFSGDQLLQVLYLIGLALQEEECNVSEFRKASNKWNLENLLEKLLNIKHLQRHREFLEWVLGMYRSQADGYPPKYNQENQQSVEQIPPCRTEEAQKTGHLSNEVKDFKFVNEKKRSIMDQMSTLQKKLLEDSSNAGKLFSSEEVDEEAASNMTVACVLCRKEEVLTTDCPTIVSPAYIQKSKVLTENYEKIVEWTLLFGLNVPFAVHIHSCGHTLHKSCWEEYTEKSKSEQGFYAPNSENLFENFSFRNADLKYLNSELNPIQNISLARRNTNYDRNGHRCPICNCLSNSVLPLAPSISYSDQSEMTFPAWIETTLCKNQPSFSFPKSSCLILDSPASEKRDTASSDADLSASCSIPMLDAVEAPADMEVFNDLPVTGDMPKRGRSLIETFVSTLSSESETLSPVESNFLLVWLSCSYTIRATEQVLKNSDKPLLEGLDFNQKYSIENMIKLSSIIFIMYKEKIEEWDVRNKIWSAILKLQSQDRPNIFLWDCFELLLPVAIKLSSLSSYDGSLQTVTFDANVFRFILLLNFAQIILYTDMNELIFLESDITSEDTKCLATIIKDFKNCSGVNTIGIWNLLKSCSLPFLRCSAILYHFLSGLQPTEALNKIGGATYENILIYLGIPNTCKDLFDCPYVNHIFGNWASLEFVQSARCRSKVLDFKRVRTLIDLPSDYSELIYKVSTFYCPASIDEYVRCPTICLSCGKILCSNEHITSQHKMNNSTIGFCTYHSYVCGGGNGLFLRVWPCKIILLSSNKNIGHFLLPPYVDNKGNSSADSDESQLRLCPKKYKELRELWLSHSFRELLNYPNSYSSQKNWHLI